MRPRSRRRRPHRSPTPRHHSRKRPAERRPLREAAEFFALNPRQCQRYSQRIVLYINVLRELSSAHNILVLQHSFRAVSIASARLIEKASQTKQQVPFPVFNKHLNLDGYQQLESGQR
jgi:hypothetical protein